jgi:precorrin-6A/cobalt-precorrin-6A reductase
MDLIAETSKKPSKVEPRFWLIGGTSESANLAQLLATRGILTTITVTTVAATRLYPDSPYLKIRVGKLLSDSEGETFCKQEQIKGIIDASHPYAIAISQRAIAISSRLLIPYLRYERPSVETTSTKVINCNNFTTLLESNYLQDERVLLTVGCNSLHLFRNWQERATLFTRILPTVNSLEIAASAGFTPDRIIALRPPVSLALEIALCHQWSISLVVSKANGTAGGEDIKQQVAEALNIPLIIISRPKLDYPQLTNNPEEVINFIHVILTQGRTPRDSSLRSE